VKTRATRHSHGLAHVTLCVYTRRFFLGRQPLKGVELTSWIFTTLTPADLSPRRDASLPYLSG